MGQIYLGHGDKEQTIGSRATAGHAEQQRAKSSRVQARAGRVPGHTCVRGEVSQDMPWSTAAHEIAHVITTSCITGELNLIVSSKHGRQFDETAQVPRTRR